MDTPTNSPTTVTQEPKIIGDAIVQTSTEKSKTPDTGLIVTTVYKGSRAKIEEKFNQLAKVVNSIDDLKVKWGDGGVSTLEVVSDFSTTLSTTTVPLDEDWEVDGNTIQDPIENNEYFSTTDTEIKKQFVQAIKDYSDKKTSTTATNAKAQKLYLALCRGQEYTLTYNVVLRKTQLYARASKVAPSFANVFSVISLSSITGLPTELSTALGALNFEWLKHPPRSRRLSTTRYQITTEYWGAKKWAGAFYPGGTGEPTA